MYFLDFKQEANHSVFHAVADATKSSLSFEYQGVALEEPSRVPTDVKLVNGYWLLGTHMNTQETFISVVKEDSMQAKQARKSGNVTASPSPPASWPPSQQLFQHVDDSDKYIVSVGFVVDNDAQTLRGALYGAGAVPQLDNNRVFATWLQRRVLFLSEDKTVLWGAGANILGDNA